jgi:hypothetical protein
MSLASILAAGFRWQAQASAEEVRACLFCPELDVGPDRFWWRCDATAEVRARHPQAVEAESALPELCRSYGHVAGSNIDRE